VGVGSWEEMKRRTVQPCPIVSHNSFSYGSKKCRYSRKIIRKSAACFSKAGSQKGLCVGPISRTSRRPTAEEKSKAAEARRVCRLTGRPPGVGVGSTWRARRPMHRRGLEIGEAVSVSAERVTGDGWIDRWRVT
jgi:hypothetical protein